MAHFPSLRWRMANPEHGDMVAIIGVNLAVGEGNRRARLIPHSPPPKARPWPASQAAENTQNDATNLVPAADIPSPGAKNPARAPYFSGRKQPYSNLLPTYA